MPATPRDTTSRLFCHYTGPFGSHTMTFHGVTDATQEDLIAAAQAVVNVIVDFQFDGTVWDSAEYAEPASAISLPVTWTPITSTSGNDPISSSGKGMFVQVGGRDGSGVRVKFYAYETFFTPTEDMRYSISESAGIGNWLDALTANDGIIGTIAGGVPTYQAYANVGFNDAAVRKARG